MVGAWWDLLHPGMLLGQEAARAPVAEGGWSCPPSFLTGLGHSGSSLAQPPTWLVTPKW